MKAQSQDNYFDVRTKQCATKTNITEALVVFLKVEVKKHS
jgi:hypothetical protein